MIVLDPLNKCFAALIGARQVIGSPSPEQDIRLFAKHVEVSDVVDGTHPASQEHGTRPPGIVASPPPVLFASRCTQGQRNVIERVALE